MEQNRVNVNKVISGLFWKFMERICAQLVTFIVSVILARLLTPEEYGTITMVMVFITIANVFVSSGLGNALIQKEDINATDFSSVFYFNIVLSILIYIVCYLAAPAVAKFYDMPLLTPLIRVLSIKIILAGINSVQHAYVSRQMIFRRFFWATIIGTVVSSVVGIAMAYSGFGVWALVAQYLTNSVIDTLVLWLTVKWRPIRSFSLARLVPLVGFGWKLLVDQLLSSIYDNLKSMVIGKVYTSADLAYYSKGIQFPNLLVTNINASIIAVLFPTFSRLQNDYLALKKAIKRSVRLGTFLLAPMLMGLYIVAPTLINIILTEKWDGCIPFLRIACIYYLFFPLTTASLEALLAIGRSDISLKLTVVKRTLGILLILGTLHRGTEAIAYSDLVVVIFAVFLNGYYLSKCIGYAVWEQLSDILPGIGSSVLMAISVNMISGMMNIGDPIVSLIMQIISGIISYILISFILNGKDLRYFIGKGKESVRKWKRQA